LLDFRLPTEKTMTTLPNNSTLTSCQRSLPPPPSKSKIQKSQWREFCSQTLLSHA
jgi:hypothetical protein